MISLCPPFCTVSNSWNKQLIWPVPPRATILALDGICRWSKQFIWPELKYRLGRLFWLRRYLSLIKRAITYCFRNISLVCAHCYVYLYPCRNCLFAYAVVGAAGAEL